MLSVVDIFEQLGKRLRTFGEDTASQQAMEQAMEHNAWFAEQDIRYALGALGEQMLDRAKIEPWLQGYPTPAHAPLRVGIIMAGNIPLVGFADLMCVIASGNIPCLKYSSKDSLMRYIVTTLRDIEPAITIEEMTEDEDIRLDALIATGGEAANVHFRAMYGSIPRLLRGSRHSVALLTGKESMAEIEALADDIFTYSGLGCRSVSLIFVPRGYNLKLPTRKMCRPYHNNYLRERALMQMCGTPFDDTGEALIVRGEASFPLALSRLHVCEYDDVAEVQAWLNEHDEQVQCIASTLPIHSRCVPLGRTQFPALHNYADECDTMVWLHALHQGSNAIIEG